MKRFPAIAILLLANLSPVVPQTYDFYHEQQYIWEGDDYDWVYCLLYDRKGFMWFTERVGLHRYDGYSFKSYYHHEPDTTSLSNNQIIILREDHEKDIWIGTLSGGLNRYNRDTDDFTRYPRSLDDPYNLRHSTIWAICVRRSGTIWFSAHNGSLSQGVYELDLQTSKINPIIHDTINPGSYTLFHTRTIYEDSGGTIWTGDAEGLHKFIAAKGSFLHFRNDPDDPYSITNDTVVSIYEDRSGTLWIGTYNGLNQFDRERHKFIRYIHQPDNPNSLHDNFIGAIIDDPEANLIIKTATGINFLDKQKRTFDFWEYAIPLGPMMDPRKEYNTFIGMRSLELDNQGTLWFIVNEGFHKLIRQKKEFTFLENSDHPSSIYLDNTGDLWFGTWNNGLYKIITDHTGMTLKSLQSKISDGINPISGLFRFNLEPEEPFNFSSDIIISICQDREGTLWFGGGLSGSLYKLELSKTKERFITYTVDFLPVTYYWRLTRIFEDLDGNLWIGKGNGLDIFDRKSEMFLPYDLDPEQHEFEDYPIINAICEDVSGCIWVGTWFQGMFKIIPPISLSTPGKATGDRTYSYKYDPDLPKDLGDHPVMTLCAPEIRKTAEIWIGTMGGGLFGLISEQADQGEYNERFIHYTIDDGLPNNTIHGILDDDNGNLWIATANGLCRFDPASGEFNRFYESDGVPVSVFTWLSGHKGKGGEMFFNAEGGLLAFHPDSITDNPVIPPVVITEFNLFNEPVPISEDSPLKRSITETSDLELSYRQNYLSFEYAALNYINTERNRYRYKMDGLDKDWIEAGDQRLASYSNLKPDKYTFRVWGSNDDGVWNEEGATVGIIIHPPPWRSWWAYALYGLFLIGIIRWYRNFLVTREKMRTDLQLEKIEVEKVQELDRMKSRFFANISHEFRTPLTLILGPIDKLLVNRPNVREFDWNLFHIMKRNAEKLKALINQILDLSKLDTGQVKLQISEGNITDFLKNIAFSYLSLAESKNIQFKYELVEMPTVFFDRDKLEKIASNLISNAFKFTPEGGKISIKLVYIIDVKDKVPEYLEFSVHDSGIGIPEDKLDKIFNRYYQVDDPDEGMQEGSGLGLALTKELVDLYRGEITVDSFPGKGSKFTVKLPVHQILFKEDEITAVKEIDKEEIYIPEPEMDEDDMERDIHRITSQEDFRNRPVVLIVEDNNDLRKFIIQCMGDSYNILEARNGSEGLNSAIEEIPDLVITDLMMPEMDGLEMCKKIKTDERTSHIPVIILTARADKASKLDGLESSADDYIIKPFDQEELQARARNLIEQRRLLREKFKYDFFIKEKVPDLKSTDERFIQKAIDTVESYLEDPDFNVRMLGERMGVSSMQLYRKLQGITDQSPSEFIRNIRLKHSVILLKKDYDNIAQIAYQVGFNNHSYYSKCFRELYGVSPAEYVRDQKNPTNPGT